MVGIDPPGDGSVGVKSSLPLQARIAASARIGRRRYIRWLNNISLFSPRRRELVGEKPCELAAAEQMLPRWTTGEVAEITDEMRLIGVAALGGRADAALGRVHPVEHRQRELEARDARQPLRRDADDLLEATFEMTASQA